MGYFELFRTLLFRSISNAIVFFRTPKTIFVPYYLNGNCSFRLHVVSLTSQVVSLTYYETISDSIGRTWSISNRPKSRRELVRFHANWKSIWYKQEIMSWYKSVQDKMKSKKMHVHVVIIATSTNQYGLSSADLTRYCCTAFHLSLLQRKQNWIQTEVK